MPPRNQGPRETDIDHPGYRAKFAADLKKQLPRLPVPVSMDDYRLMVKVGRDLAALHLHYEDIEGYGLKEVWTGAAADARDARPYQVKKMSWGKKGKDEDRSKIVVIGMLPKCPAQVRIAKPVSRDRPCTRRTSSQVRLVRVPDA